MGDGCFFAMYGCPKHGGPADGHVIPGRVSKVCLFVCFITLRPNSTAMVMVGWSVYLTTLSKMILFIPLI